MLLDIKTRQTYLKALGFYTGAIDGIVGNLTKSAYRQLQQNYFIRKSDIDGIYGNDTDLLLRNAYKVHLYCRNFGLSEFMCECGGRYCTGYPAELDTNLLKGIQAVRDKSGATTITSGMRCKPYNNSLAGSSSTSRHMSGKAVDFVNAQTSTLSKRRALMQYIRGLKGYNYTYCNENGSAPNMGNAIHFDVR